MHRRHATEILQMAAFHHAPPPQISTGPSDDNRTIHPGCRHEEKRRRNRHSVKLIDAAPRLFRLQRNEFNLEKFEKYFKRAGKSFMLRLKCCLARSYEKVFVAAELLFLGEKLKDVDFFGEETLSLKRLFASLIKFNAARGLFDLEAICELAVFNLVGEQTSNINKLIRVENGIRSRAYYIVEQGNCIQKNECVEAESKKELNYTIVIIEELRGGPRTKKG